MHTSSVMVFWKRLQQSFLLLSMFISVSGLNISLDYDPYLRPNHGAVADICNVSLKILTIREINSHNNMEITVDFIISKGWTDPRLQNLVRKETPFLNGFPHKIWTPDLYIVNAISIMPPEEIGRTFRLKPEGELILKERMAARINCPTMSFAKFPFDKQVCHLKLQSYSYNLINLDMVWNGLISQMDVQLGNPEYTLSILDQSVSKETLSNGQHRSLIVNLTLRRCGLRFVFRALIPLAVLVFIAYLTLFIQGESQVPPSTSVGAPDGSQKSLEVTSSPVDFDQTQKAIIRLSINGLMILLATLVSQLNWLHAPTTTTITGLDIWISITNLIILFVFIQNLAFFIVGRNKNNQKDANEDGNIETHRLTKIYKWLKLGIPLFFVFFSIIFFVVYLT